MGIVVMCAYDNSGPLAARRINSLLNIFIDLKRAFLFESCEGSCYH